MIAVYDRPMPDLKQIEAIENRSAAENWTYPQLFEALKNLGLDRYEVDVLNYETKFVGGGTAATKAAPIGWEPLRTGPWNKEGLQAALKRIQNQQTDYQTFLREIAAAGVSFYRVDFKPRTVTYHGPKPYKLVEPVPAPAKE
jgi:uncharacterized protein YbcV (DUF1398 family)